MNKIIFGVLAIILIVGFVILLSTEDKQEEMIACTADAMMCPDGSWVGRTGPDCEFVCPPPPEVPEDIQVHIDDKANLITIDTPVPYGVIMSPLTVTGEARGSWYFEADFPIALTDWNGLIIAEVPAMTQEAWMTEDFVPFVATLEFESPYSEGDPDFMKNGFLIMQKDNPTGLPEHDNALEIPVRFAP